MRLLESLSIPAKSGLAAAITLTVAGAAQSLLLDRSVHRALALGVPLAASTAVGYAFAAWLVRYRTRALVEAMKKIAAGALDVEMPPAPDADLLVVRDAFSAMTRRLRETTSRLRHQDAQRRRLFGDLVHEIAHPTGTILGTSELLGDPGTVVDAARRARMLAAIGEEAARLARLVDDMRDLATLDDPDVGFETEQADVAAIVRSVVARAADPNVVAETETAVACIDPARIEQVVVNLVSNASRHGGGAVRLRVTGRVDSVEVVVDDDGPGVAEELLPRLGERLVRADASRSCRTGGHGLGLSIVSAIVQRHGGTLAFGRSDLGGLRVTVTLPRQDHLHTVGESVNV